MDIELRLMISNRECVYCPSIFCLFTEYEFIMVMIFSQGEVISAVNFSG